MKKIIFAVAVLTLTMQTAFATGGNGKVEIRLLANNVQIRITDPDGVAAWFAYNVQNNRKVPPPIAKENPANPLCGSPLVKLFAGIGAQQVWVDYFDCEETPHRESWIMEMPVDTVWREGRRTTTLSLSDLQDDNKPTVASDGTRWITPVLQAVTILLLIVVLIRLRRPKDISR